MYDLVLFDLDGTLVDTAPDIADAVNGVLADHGRPPVAEAWVRNRIGHGTRRLLEQAIVAHDDDAAPPLTAALDELVEDFAEHYAHCCGHRGRLFPDVATTLSSLRFAGVKLALLTNKERRFVRFVLEVHGLNGDFDLEICGDSLAAKKPDALPVAHCCEVLQVPKERALLVGDSEIDVKTARNAGIAVWAVTYGYNQGQPIGRAHPDRLIDLLAEVLGPFADRLEAAAGRKGYVPRASSSSLYLRSNPRN
jgi:phosphoglycolate phosphatase